MLPGWHPRCFTLPYNMKTIVIIALLGISTLANATSITGSSCTVTSPDVSSAGLLFCNLPSYDSVCTYGTLPTGGYCDFTPGGYGNGNCFGSYNNGGCQGGNNNCPPKDCPDSAATVYALGLALLGLEVSRRKFALAK